MWLFLGPLVLLLLLLGILQTGSGWFTGLDFAVLVVTGVMLLSRWAEQRSGQAVTVSGEPSTWSDFRRYAVLLPVVMAVAWVMANALGNTFGGIPGA